MTRVVYDATAPGTEQHVAGPGDLKHRRHAEDPYQPGRAICGTRIKPEPGGSGDCPLCEALIHGNRTWITR